MKTILSPIQDKPVFRLRAFGRRTIPAVVAWAFLVSGAMTAVAQEDDQPAWERIGEKLSPNSLEESSPEELPTVILPGDEEDSAGYDGGDEAYDDESIDAGEIQQAEAAMRAAALEQAAMEESGEEQTATSEDETPAQKERMETAAPGTIGLPQAGRGRRGDENINLGRESDDDGTVVNLFDDPEVRRMLGDNPRFIYGALTSPDPMVFPPVRNAAIYSELTMEAERLIKQGKLEEAQQRYKRILDLNDKRYMLEMRNKIAQLNNRIGRASMVLDDEPLIEVKLPQWIRVNTRGILFDEADPMVLVGDYTLHVGDPVPSHPEVRVEAVTKRTVTYRVADRKSFNVAVKGFQE